MLNTSIEICTNILNYNNTLHISYIVWHTCGLLCTIFGIPGHLFQILIMLNKTNRKQSISLYFLAIAIFELIFLVGIFWLWCVDMSIIKTDLREIISCGIFYSILVGPTILSNLYLALMSIDRTFMILYPTRYRLLITRRHVLIRIFLILIIVILFMIPHHFYFYYNRKTTIFICEFYTFIDHWKIRAWPFLHAILFVLLPSIITCISSVILLHNRCNQRKITKNKSSETARRMTRNAILIFLISIFILFSLLPTVIVEIFIVNDRLFNHDIFCSIRWKQYRILLNWFLTLSALNYSSKFYLRLIISKTFRRDFIKLINFISLRQQKNNEQSLVPLNNRNTAKNTER
ncbi:unnamed protein product [Rotaria sordida]|uniref:G-protein coupled receptors family 1 profile domain-containing protein n=1 Tax=Rotaria sordida TaxID=392033 RepID=A0A814UCT8_9BILA|nr:unnamed protein product [Rotaria sordida]CAF1174968.1 unnamed protein product [Rotaria sordida]